MKRPWVPYDRTTMLKLYDEVEVLSGQYKGVRGCIGHIDADGGLKLWVDENIERDGKLWLEKPKLRKLMTEVRMVLGYPASGKSTLSKKYLDQNYTHLNRDTEGGLVSSLIPKMEKELAKGRSVVLDNLFPDIASRKGFISAAKAAGIPIHCEWMATSIEESTINALHRMWERYGRIFYTSEEIREHTKAKKDPNIFPIAALFHHRKVFEEPTESEGFASVNKTPFVRRPLDYTNKALILDYDETLRTVEGGKFKFPTKVEEVKLLPNRKVKLKEYLKKGYVLLGVSNQSGIARDQVEVESVIKCFQRTNQLLGLDIPFHFCSHSVPPKCYCRKPASGIGVELIHRFQLDASQCIYVGDRTTDKTWAKRLGMEYFDESDFFEGE
ncbi:MAG: HAD-IIIA family hydrolase [Candidatus Thorarchaeota archaeon]